jgi:FAD/FMN-containing dehydrogenase
LIDFLMIVIGIQTIAGCLGTGTHGQGLKTVPMSDSLIAVTLVKADGTLASFNNEDDPNMMDALRINLGLLGVIVNVTLRIQPLRIMTCNKSNIKVNEFKEGFTELQKRDGLFSN